MQARLAERRCMHTMLDDTGQPAPLAGVVQRQQASRCSVPQTRCFAQHLCGHLNCSPVCRVPSALG